MDTLIEFLIRQKKLALVFTLSIIVVGLLVAQSIQRDQFPNVDLDIMFVVAGYPGNSPEDVELGITNLIEDDIKDIAGIKSYTSVSQEGRMELFIEIEPGISDTEKVKQEIKDGVNKAKGFPQDLDNLPTIIDVKPAGNVVLQLNLSDKTASYDQMRNWVNFLEKALLDVEGVSQITKSGYLPKEVTIYLDAKKLSQYRIDLDQISQAIANKNKRYTAGHSNSKTDERNFVVLSKFNKPEEVLEVVVSSSFEGPEIRLKDIARVVIGNKEQQSITRINGKKGFILRLQKQDNADIIKTVAAIKAKMQTLKDDLPESLDFFYTHDSSFLVKNRLKIVSNNGLIGLLLILVVLSIFLSTRSAFWVAASLPVVVFGMVILLKIFGETINLVSLAAVILVLGLVVDDSIIIAESIHHYRQKIKDRYKATLFGFKRVIAPILATILTTILAFSSMFLMTGTLGKFIYIMPVVVIFALVISLLEISIALPAHLADAKMGKERQWFKVFERFFQKISLVLLRFRYLVVFVFMLIFSAAIWLGSEMKYTLFPEVGTDKINASIELEPGNSLLATEQKVIELENIIISIVGEDLDSVSSEIGQDFDHIARLDIALKPAADRNKTGRELNDTLEEAVKSITGVKEIIFSVRKPGPPVGEDIEIGLVGPNNQQRRQAADELANILKNSKGFSSLERDDKTGKGRIEVILDYQKIAKFGLSLSVIKQYLQTTLTGSVATRYREGKDDIEFRLYLDNNKDISSLKIPNNKGLLIPIERFSRLTSIKGESNYNHYNGERSVVISGSVDEEIISADALIAKALKQLDLIHNYPEVQSVLVGGSDESQKSIQSFAKAFGLAIIGIYLLLMLLFNSYTQPLMVISSIPLSIVGVIVAFYFHGLPISFFTILGTLALVGVIVNDALILVSHLNYIQKEQPSQQTIQQRIVWIAKGARDRLRAVILTTLTTLAGVLPLAYGIGGVDYILQPMALALGYGLVFGTIMTLILMPALYLINLEIREFFSRIFAKKPATIEQ